MTAINTAAHEPGSGYGTEASAGRQSGLADALSRLRRTRSADFPLARVLLIVGGLLLPIGVILIIVGWYGSAHTLNLYEQNDYLISGGLLGLALVIIGGQFYFGYWMTHQLQVARATLQQTQGSYSQLEAHVNEVVASTAALVAVLSNSTGGGPTRRSRSAERPLRVGGADELVATERGALMHKPSCPAVAGKANLRHVSADDPQYRPCQICNPREDG